MNKQEKLAKLIRYYILMMTTQSGSGHPTSSLSAVELMISLYFRHLRYDLENPDNPANDRVIFSKGHASPLFYSLHAAAGVISEEELKKYRNFNSNLEGHPSMKFSYTVAPTGSLGQGLSVGIGTSLNAEYLDQIPYRTFVLLGDGEMAEGQIWEALQIAAQYRLGSLIAILDVNRLGQSGETMLGNALYEYEERFSDFGWRTVVVEDGHDFEEVNHAFDQVLDDWGRVAVPKVIIANTVKGKGISFLEDKEGWHGKALDTGQFDKAVKELSEIDKDIRGEITVPTEVTKPNKDNSDVDLITFEGPLATRKAYGQALVNLGNSAQDIIALDGDVRNSTYASDFFEKFPERSFEMFIAEQNMISTGVGLATTDKIPYISTFSAFLSRAHDQIRMAAYSGQHLVIVGSHAGVSIGQDGFSQMGLEDISMFRSLFNSTVLYPSDAYATEKLVYEAYKAEGIVYLRTTRMDTPLLYGKDEEFPIGGSKVLKESDNDVATVVAAGITVHQALKVYEELEKKGTKIRVIDAYSIKPIDKDTIVKAAKETGVIITVEDHRPEGGLGDAVLEALAEEKGVVVHKMAVTKMPRSGEPEELLEYEEINAKAITNKLKS